MKPLLLLSALFVSLMIFPMGADAQGPDSPAQPPVVVNLWPAGSPTLQGASEKELLSPPNPAPGQRINSIRNVHVPTIEVHLPPADKANGTSMLVAPGGGHEQLVWASEGTDVAKWLNDRGIAAFVLKYRLAKTPNYHYTVEGEALQDTQRALRIMRSRAKEWNIDPNRIGMIGFSAGGALAALADIRFDRGKAGAADPIDQQSCRPDFVALVYPGWEPMDITAPKDAAPAFLTSAGSDDTFHARQTVEFFMSLFNVGVPADLHIYAHGGHGGGLGKRKGIPFGTWPDRLTDWLADKGLLTPK